MRPIILVVSILFITLTQTIEAQSLKDYQWKNRVVLLVAKSSDTHALISQLDVLTVDKKALMERDLIIFRVTPTKIYTSDGTETDMKPLKIYWDCDLDIDFTGIVLLGKDGGVKMRELFEVATSKIFSLIDGMPMRRREIRESGEN